MSLKKNSLCVLSLIIITTVFSHPSYHNIFKNNKLPLKVQDDNSNYFIQDETIPILVEGSIADIESMESLRLNYDGIKVIQPGAFQNLPNLTWIDISYNEIEKIENGVFNNLTNVTYLNLGNNAISTIDPEAFDNMLSLDLLTLDDNKLTVWDYNWFTETPSLRSFYVSRNLIEVLPPYAFGQSNETDNNDPFYIFLEDNIIIEISEDAFANLGNVVVLSLAGNKLGFFNGNFLRNLTLGSLFINNNQLECIDEEDFETSFVANVTRIFDNPMNDTCLDNMKIWNENHSKKLITTSAFAKLC